MAIDIRNADGTVLYTYEDGTDLRDADLRGVDLHGADLRGADLTGANLQGADLHDADLHGADLPGANLRDADLHGANLQGADLQGADLHDAVLADMDLHGTDLRDADLHGADLTDANLTDANLTDADLTRADLRGANLRGANLTDVYLAGARMPAAWCRGCHTYDDCQCDRCEHCEERTDDCQCDRCSDCNEVVEECTCDKDEDCSYSIVRTKARPRRAVSPKERKLFDCSRMTGVEVEYTKCSDFDPIKNWADAWQASVHEDGSCGWECVTAPAAGDYLPRQLSDLVAAMKEAECVTNADCGIHVHVDASDYYWEDVRRLAAVWAKIEPVMFLLGGQHRLHNTYCKPMGETFKNALVNKDAKGALLGAILYKTSNSRDYVRSSTPLDKKDQHRYTAINFLPWLSARVTQTSYVGRTTASKTNPSYLVHRKSAKLHERRSDCTIEFRLHRELTGLADGSSLGSVQRRLIGWAKLCTRIVDWAAKATQKDVDALPRNAFRALAIIAPDLREYCLGRLRGWRTAVKWQDRRIRYTPATGYVIRNR